MSINQAHADINDHEVIDEAFSGAQPIDSDHEAEGVRRDAAGFKIRKDRYGDIDSDEGWVIGENEAEDCPWLEPISVHRCYRSVHDGLVELLPLRQRSLLGHGDEIDEGCGEAVAEPCGVGPPGAPAAF